MGDRLWISPDGNRPRVHASWNCVRSLTMVLRQQRSMSRLFLVKRKWTLVKQRIYCNREVLMWREFRSSNLALSSAGYMLKTLQPALWQTT